ncbi:CbtA family protein [Aestuariivirga sp.]|uniref:CbtA family protein n=1 Tax=Aestuariivirga sp. TaxID=2650926 RepID=UPI00391BA8AD
MIGRVVLAALLAGIAAGLIMGAIQHLRLTPLILEAEAYERAADVHSHAPAGEPATAGAEAPAGGHDHDHGEGWAPEDGWQRTLATTLTAAMAGAGFAAILAAVSLVSGIPLTRENGMVWGLCGFLAASLAPSIGLPPELPGMPAADLVSRQAWWAGTIIATGAGIFLLATRREAVALAAAVLLIGAPHVIGAPVAAHQESSVPPGLAAAFAANSIAANAIFWVLIGQFLGMALNRYAKEAYAA